MLWIVVGALASCFALVGIEFLVILQWANRPSRAVLAQIPLDDVAERSDRPSPSAARGRFAPNRRRSVETGQLLILR